MKTILNFLLFIPFIISAQSKCISGNCEDGIGYWKDISGFSYNGSFKNGEMSGEGKLIFSKTYQYGDELGKSYMHFEDAISYEGKFQNSQPNGQGLLLVNDGSKYEGQFNSGDLIKGKIFLSQEIGYVLIGDFIENQLQNPGIIEYYNGNKYEGEVKNNVPNGEGTMYYPTKSKDVGFWENGRFLTGTQISKFDIIKLKRDGDSYKIDVKLNGVPVNNMIFDTGAEMISLSASYLPTLIENGTISEDDIIGNANFRNANGSINTELVINIKEIQIGNKTIENVLASICKECVLKGINLLGMNAIKELGNIYIDFENDRLILNRYLR
jgi:clan AA aspartic protease (TIGR02281 family)|tara:strand:- start:4216 stop:5193 length:978 start_codon:yes stop_codon:yes gene_type:complete